MSPLFSIIIPTYNSQKTIRRCIDSVLSQTFNDYEIIVVDNYSSDDTFKILNTYDGLKIYQENNNGIIAHSRNVGIKFAKGKWICFLDSDDWWDRNKLENVAFHVEDNDFIYHPLMMRFGKANFLSFNRKIGRNYEANHIFEDILLNGNFAPTSSVSIRKAVIDKLGLISEDIDLRGVEDTDYYLRVAKFTSRFYYLDKILGYYWIDNNTSISLKQVEKEEHLYIRHVEKLPICLQRKALMQLDLKKARIYHKVGCFNEAMKFYNKCLRIRFSFKVLMLMLLAFFRISQ